MAQKTSPEGQKTFEQIKNYKSIKDLPKIKEFIAKNPAQEVTLEAYFLKAKILSHNNKTKEACDVYHQLVQSPVDYNQRFLIYKTSASCLFKAGKLKTALKTLEQFIKNPRAKRLNKTLAAKIKWGYVKNKAGFIHWKLNSLSYLFLLSQAEDKKTWSLKAQSLIKSLNPSDLIYYAEKSSLYPGLSGELLSQAGEYFLKQKEFKRAKLYFKKALSKPLSLEQKQILKNQQSMIKKITKVNPYLIGVLVPLSGRRKALGEKILKSLYLGLDMENNSSWQLLVADSKSHPDVVRAEIDNMFYKNHVMALIGGLNKKTAQVIAEKSESFALPSVIFSKKQGLSANREFVFQNTVTAEGFLNLLVKELKENLKVNKVATLYPEDSYGTEYAELFSKLFKKQGGRITNQESYKTGEVDFKKQIKKMLKLELKGREKEYEQRKQEFLEKNPNFNKRSRKLSPERLLTPEYEFSALFIPDTLNQTLKIKKYLKYFELKNIYLLGAELWLNSKMPKAPEDLAFVFVNLKQDPLLFKKSLFYKNYLKFYKQAPGLFEERAYNSAMFLKQALSQGARSRLDLLKQLKSIKNFKGAYYNISLSDEGLFHYPLTVYKVGSIKQP